MFFCSFCLWIRRSRSGSGDGTWTNVSSTIGDGRRVSEESRVLSSETEDLVLEDVVVVTRCPHNPTTFVLTLKTVMKVTLFDVNINVRVQNKWSGPGCGLRMN